MVVGLLMAFLIVIIGQIEQRKSLEKQVLIVEYNTLNSVDEITIPQGMKVKPVIYENLPDLDNLPADQKKIAFIYAILPSILVCKYSLDKEKKIAENIYKKIQRKHFLSKEDSLYIIELMDQYNVVDIPDLMYRLGSHPTSIVIAQAAIESGWGQSRFLKKGNNLFGVWSYSKSGERMEAWNTREGKSIYVRKYDTIYESLEDYFKTIATTWAYQKFRQKRIETDNPFELIWYLNYYSELRYDYVQKLGVLIVQNDLHKYDQYTLDSLHFVTVDY